jgi:hypothetical protein
VGCIPGSEKIAADRDDISGMELDSGLFGERDAHFSDL